jgi:acyl-CoA oxidase
MSSTVSASADTSAAPDPAALCRFLDGDHHDIKEEVRQRLADFGVSPPAEQLPRDEYRAQVTDWMVRLAATGQPAMLFPESAGGQGDPGAAIAAFEMLGHGDLSLLVKCGVQFGLFGGAVHHLGNEEHHRKYLGKVATAELFGCFAMTESGHGSNVQAVETTASYDGDASEWVVHTPTESARKDYIGNAARDGRMAVVFAQLEVGGEEHGVHALLVPIRDEDGNVLDGVTIEDDGDKLGLQGVDNGRIWFDHVRVPRENLLDRYAKVGEDGLYDSPIENKDRRFFTTIGTLIQGRVSVSGAALSATKSSLAIAVRYANRRRQFGPPDSGDEALLLDYRAHQRRLLPRLATTYAIHFAQRELVASLHEALTTDDHDDHAQRQLEARAAGVKAASTWHATETIQACREACGGAGYLMVNRFAAMKADTDVFTTFEGDNTILLQLVAKGLLTDFKQRVGDLNALEMVRFYGEQVMDQVVERSLARQVIGAFRDIVPTGDDDSYDDERIEDRDWQLELFRWREEHVLGGVARRLRAGLDDGADTFEVFNECQDHVLAAARAHVDRLILEAFARGLDGCEDDSLKPALDRLFDLHALSTVERERGWFFEHGRMTAPRSKAITKAVNRLCAELRNDAEALTDAFAIPDKVLAAPIAIGADEASATG